MRILSIGFMYPPHDLGGGYEVTWRSAVTHMRGKGDDVRVLASDFRASGEPPAQELDADVHRELRTYWRDHDFPRLRWKERTALERHNGDVLERHLADFRPDAVNWWAMGGMSMSLIERVRRMRIPAVGVVGDDWIDWGPRADAWVKGFRRLPGSAALAERLTGLPARVELAQSGVWLFNSETVRRKALLAVPDLAAELAHPGIDEDLFGPAPAKDWTWQLLCLGRLDPRKGVHIAIEALPHLPGEARLTLQGGGDDAYLAELRALVERLDLADRITFSSRPRDQLPAVYAEADAVLFPVQWDEPWGLVPLEAMAVGRPVVASGTGGSAEYLRDGENSVIYAPRDSAPALAAAVKRLADEPELRDRLREQGQQTAARYTETAYNERIRAALAEAVAHGPAPAA